MNRAAPDTVDACAARVSRALFRHDKEVDEAVLRAAAAAAGAAFARRAAREPTYASTHAKVLRRVASAPFREKATEVTLQTLRRLALASPPSRRSVSDDVDAEGAAAFAAALTERETTESACDQAERARVRGAVAAALARSRSRGDRLERGDVRALRRRRARRDGDVRRGRRRADARAPARAIASARDDAHRASKPSSAPPLVLESGARFPPNARSSRWIVRTIRRLRVNRPFSKRFLGSGSGSGRGRALPAAPRARAARARAQSRAETHAAAEARRPGNAAEATGKRRRV